MSDDPTTSSEDSVTTEPTSPSSCVTTTTTGTTTTFATGDSTPAARVQSAIRTLSTILTTIPPSLSSTTSSTQELSFSLLHHPDVSSQISSLLRLPESGAGDNNLCRWLYDTFQSTDPDLQLVVLRFVPIIAGLYLSRVPLRKPQAGFEAVLLALYAHETNARAGQSLTVNVPDLSHPSIYHESKTPFNNNSTDLNIAVLSSSLEPHGTVRSTRRARIVGVALELYYTKLSQMPVGSKMDFCEFCEIWSGQDGEMYKEKDQGGEESRSGKIKVGKEGMIHLAWELLQPVMRILAHCLLGPNSNPILFEAASGACRSLYARFLHDINPKAILATESLLKLAKLTLNSKNDIDYTEIPDTALLTI